MLRRTVSILLLATTGALGVISIAAAHSRSPHPDASIVHEWGTFTTVAGLDGRAIDWVPFGGPTDLPCFVEHLGRDPVTKYVASNGQVQVYDGRSSLRAKVRMETPVLYFYGPRSSVNVRVRFPHGVMTEWYPTARLTNPAGVLGTLADAKQSSVIEWNNVSVGEPESTRLPGGEGESHYYAARKTDASVVRVGDQAEKFLFYRGIANFDVPIATTPQANGHILVSNLSSQVIPAVVLLDVRGNTLGYRVVRDVRGEVSLPAPELTASLADLRSELEKTLVGAGLYAKEASAMVDTWSDSWFEDGTRVFYIVPPHVVDATLPLDIRPTPASVSRVFVGRMEILTARMERDVQAAISRNDAAALERYGRFLGPITERLLAKETDAAAKTRIQSTAGQTFNAFIARVGSCK